MLKSIRDRIRERRLKKESWDGIVSNNKSALTEKEGRIWTLLLKAFLVYMVTGGMFNAFLSAVSVDYNELTVQAVILLACLYLVSLYYNKIWENVGYIILLFFMVYVALKYQAYINSGFYGIVNGVSEEISVYFDSNAMRSFGEKVSNRPLAITIAASYMGIVTAAIFNILISRKMNTALISLICFSFLCIPAYLELEPSFISVVQLSVPIFLAPIFKRANHTRISHDNRRYIKKGHKYSYIYGIKAGAELAGIVLLTVLLVSVFLELIIPRDDIHERYKEAAIKTKSRDVVEIVATTGISGLFNYYPNTNGLSTGKLGGVSSITRDYNTDLYVTFIPYTDERIYLRSLVTAQYVPYDNMWLYVPAISQKTEISKQTEYMMKNKTSSKGTMLVENVAANAATYLPYFSLNIDEGVELGQERLYTFYNSENLNKSGKVEEEETDIYLKIPEENMATIEKFCKDMGASKKMSVDELTNLIGDYFQKNIPYSYQPGATPRNKDFVNYFLNENRKGYCAHFASAATLAYRYMGVPARYVEGYAIDVTDLSEEGNIIKEDELPEDIIFKGYNPIGNKNGIKVNVTDANAHAWLEVYEAGKGWKPVDITPASETDEGPDLSILGRLNNLISGNDSNASNRASKNVRTVGGSDIVTSIGEGLVKAMAFLIIVLGIGFMIFIVYREIRRYFRYKKGNVNDKLIVFYEDYIKRMSKKLAGLGEANNYDEQIEILGRSDYNNWTREDRERIVEILEKAGFSNKMINPSENIFIKNKLKSRKK